jgi:germination protein M
MKKLLKLFKLKKFLLIFGVATLLIGAGVYVVIQNNGNQGSEIDVNVDVNKDDLSYRRVYLLNDKGIVVPLSVSFVKKDDLAEELVYITTLLRAGSPVVKGNIHPILNKDVKINSLKIENRVLTIDFSAEFANYAAKDELRILEALAWTYSQYNEVGSLKISVDGTVLTHMPINKTPIPNPLNRDIGINNHIFRREMNTTSVITFFETKLNDKTVYVPVTKGVALDGTFLNTVTKHLTDEASILSGLKTVKEFENVEIVSATLKEGNILELELGVSALVDETSISKELYDLLVIHYTQVNNIESVSIIVEGEAMQISGYDEDEVIPISSIIYNEVKI